jgi:hypothetical protein
MKVAARRSRIKKLLEDDQGRGLSTLQLATFLRGDKVIQGSKTFVKVVPRDLLASLVPQISAHLAVNSKHKPCIAVICNNQTSSQPGEHWVLVFHSFASRRVEFFCSYGLKLNTYPKDIESFCVSLNKLLSLPASSTVSNRSCVQGLFSSVCGHLCMLLTLLRVRKYSVKHFLDLVKTSPPGECDPILSDILLDGRFHLQYDGRLEQQFKREAIPIQHCCRRISCIAAAAAI